jgi:hypothetical protein
LRRVRVVLAEMPTLLHEIVSTILSTDPDVELDATPVPTDEIDSADAVARADVLATSDDYSPTLFAHPRLRLVAISDDRKHAVLYELRPHRAPLGELSPQLLVRAVHGGIETFGGGS